MLKPLSNITILDFTVNVPGPFCTTILADLGARVIKVEPPGGDPFRHEQDMWNNLNRGKESIVLNLKSAGDRKILARLIQNIDVVLEGWRPGVSERLGAAYPTLSKVKADLIYCSISGFGQEGPWRNRPGHDINYLALSGLLSLYHHMDGRPWPPSLLLSDLTSGIYASIMVLAAINSRNETGNGTYIDLSMTETVLSLLGPELSRINFLNQPVSYPNVTHIPTYGLFQCSDGKWFSLGIVHEDHFWDRFCAVSGLSELLGMKFNKRLENRQLIIGKLNEVFATLPAHKWEEWSLNEDIPGAIVVDLEDTLSSPQFSSRETFSKIGRNSFVKQPARFSTLSVDPEKEPPKLGEHTDLIMEELGQSC